MTMQQNSSKASPALSPQEALDHHLVSGDKARPEYALFWDRVSQLPSMPGITSAEFRYGKTQAEKHAMSRPSLLALLFLPIILAVICLFVPEFRKHALGIFGPLLMVSLALDSVLLGKRTAQAKLRYLRQNHSHWFAD